MCVCVCVLSSVWLCHPMDCNLPGSSVHEIFWSGIVKLVAISYSRGSSLSRDQICISYVSCTDKWILSTVPPGKPQRFNRWFKLVNRCIPTVVLEKTSESPLESKEIKPVNLKGNQPQILFGKTNSEAEVSILWSYDGKSRLIGKKPDVEKDWRQKEKRVTENVIVEWHHWFSRLEFGQTPRDGERQRSLTCYSLWGCEESDTTWRLNNSNKKFKYQVHRIAFNRCRVFFFPKLFPNKNDFKSPTKVYSENVERR